MSDEGGVTPSDEVLEISPPKVTPEAGKGALGTWRFRAGLRHRAEITIALNVGTIFAGKPSVGGVYMSQHLSLPATWEGREGISQGQNRTREIRPSGIVGGPMETWVMGVGLRPGGKLLDTPPNPKAVARHSSIPTAHLRILHCFHAPAFFPNNFCLQPSHQRILLSALEPANVVRTFERQCVRILQ